MDPMEVDRVRVIRCVDEVDPDAVPFRGLDRGPGYTSVVGPGREEDPGGNLDVFDCGDELVLAHGAAGAILRDLAAVEVGQDLVRVESVADVVDGADRAVTAVTHR